MDAKQPLGGVVFANRFMASVARLSTSDRRAIDSAVMELARGSTARGLRLHKLNCREPRFHSISASDSLRVILLVDGTTRVLMHAAQHDAAYRWAESHEVRRHELTGVPQIIEYVDAVERRVRFVDETIARPPLFASVTDEQLVRLGLPSSHVDLIRRVTDEDTLTELGDAIPEEAWEALVEIFSGVDPDELINDQASPEPRGRGTEEDFAAVLSTPEARRRFWVADSEDALVEALSMPWAAWRVFLHPSQARAVDIDHGGPARVTGGAGTGKSVVLVHRAARHVRENPKARVLLSTFGRALAAQLRDALDQLVGQESSARQRVRVIHLHAHAVAALGDAGQTVKAASSSKIRVRIDAAIAATGYAARPAAFVREEWHRVIDVWGIRSKESYRQIARTGRGQSLSAAQRAALWPVFQHVHESLAADGLETWSDLCERAAVIGTEQGNGSFDHVLLDEAQDFGPRELSYAASLADGSANAFFVASDDGQRIYRNPFPLSAIGINIRGRSRRLRVNYRTSAEIHAFAARVLPGEWSDDEVAHSRRVVSLFGGTEPELFRGESPDDEAERLVRWVDKQLGNGLIPDQIALFARQLSRLQTIELALSGRLGLRCVLLGNTDCGSLVKGTLHGGKGLEFRAVAVVGAEEGVLPMPAALEGEPGDEAYELSLARERHLLYVGCTRARDTLLVTHVGRCSRFLVPMSPA